MENVCRASDSLCYYINNVDELSVAARDFFLMNILMLIN